MSRKIAILALAMLALIFAYPAHAQKTGKVYRVGFLTPGSPGTGVKRWLTTFRQGLQRLGYVEGKNIIIEERYAKGRYDRLPKLTVELLSLKVDVIVTHGGSAARVADRAAKEAGRAIPIVFAVSADPIGDGAVASLARPGGNITGLSNSHSDLLAKRLEFLKEVVPSASRIAVIWNPAIPTISRQLKALQAVAPALGVTLIPVEFKGGDDLDSAFAAIRKERPDALNVLGYPQIATYRRQIAAFALKNGLPAIGTVEPLAVVGLLMTYGASLVDLYRRAATYVDKILKGAKPADIPVEQPTRFYLTINLKTAKKIGITIPPEVLFRATKVIK